MRLPLAEILIRALTVPRIIILFTRRTYLQIIEDQRKKKLPRISRQLLRMGKPIGQRIVNSCHGRNDFGADYYQPSSHSSMASSKSE